uniref:Uncharacterized protein n=1 Tax=Clytia hemisphaerica TaxID=252671 RepID=A0A7M5XIZ5_9CNID
MAMFNKIMMLTVLIGALNAMLFNDDPIIKECKEIAEQKCTKRPLPLDGNCCHIEAQECLDQHKPSMPRHTEGMECVIAHMQYPISFTGVADKYSVGLPYYHCTPLKYATIDM